MDFSNAKAVYLLLPQKIAKPRADTNGPKYLTLLVSFFIAARFISYGMNVYIEKTKNSVLTNSCLGSDKMFGVNGIENLTLFTDSNIFL